MRLLEQAMQPEVLNAVWNRLKVEHTPWSATVERDQLQRDLMQHLLACRAEVLAGHYRPQPLRRFTIPKTDGEQRHLVAQYLRDKLVQRALLTVLMPRAEALFHPDSYAYRPERGVRKALETTHQRIARGQSWLVDADIKQFFDTIPVRHLQEKLRGFVRDEETMKLMTQWLQQGSQTQGMFGVARGIPQGAVLSPLFCNLFMHEFDLALANKGIPFVRFADDFLLFADNKTTAERYLDYARRKLTAMSLELNANKTCIIRSSPETLFLGKPLPLAKPHGASKYRSSRFSLLSAILNR